MLVCMSRECRVDLLGRKANGYPSPLAVLAGRHLVAHLLHRDEHYVYEPYGPARIHNAVCGGGNRHLRRDRSGA